MKPILVTFVFFLLIMSAVLAQASDGWLITRTTVPMSVVELVQTENGWSTIRIDGEYLGCRKLTDETILVVRPWLIDKGISIELLSEGTSKLFPVTLTLSNDYVVRFIPAKKTVFEFIIPFVTQEQYDNVRNTIIAAHLSSDNFLLNKFLGFNKGDLMRRTSKGMKAVNEADFSGLQEILQKILKLNRLESQYQTTREVLNHESKE